MNFLVSIFYLLNDKSFLTLFIILLCLDGDTLIFFDYRADRMREITECMGMERYKDLKSDIKHPKDMVCRFFIFSMH